MAQLEETKKDRIVTEWLHGEHDIWKLAEEIDCRPSYVASVLQKQGLLHGYYDLYTSLESQEMNIYAPMLKGQLGFKNEDKAKESIRAIDELYKKFELAGDKAGQHHALVTALTLFNRARWSSKIREADVFRRWLNARLNELDTEMFTVSPSLAKSQHEERPHHH
jgi:hypothetical protein